MIAERDLSKGPFQARRDPFSIDFERIAAERAAKQYQFKRDEEDEQKPWDVVHGGRYSYHGEHVPEDKELQESKKHAKLDEAFHEAASEYHAHTFEKPTFDLFRLQFDGPHSQVADQIPSEDMMASSKEELHHSKPLSHH